MFVVFHLNDNLSGTLLCYDEKKNLQINDSLSDVDEIFLISALSHIFLNFLIRSTNQLCDQATL